jgi:hypothetical protein
MAGTEASTQYQFDIMEEPVILVSIDKAKAIASMHLIIKLLYYSDDDNFTSLTVSDDELSLITSEKKFNENCDKVFESKGDFRVYITKYYVFKIYQHGEDVGKVGIVSKLSKIMAENGVPILYITTFNNDYILVEHDKKEEAKKCLLANGCIEV